MEARSSENTSFRRLRDPRCSESRSPSSGRNVNLNFDPGTAAELAKRTAYLIGAAQELSAFGEQDPALAGECGVEICSLEARTILSGGAPFRVMVKAEESGRFRRPVAIAASDLEAVSRLEAVVSMGTSRIDLKAAALDATIAQEPTARIGNLIGLATGAIGFIKSFL